MGAFYQKKRKIFYLQNVLSIVYFIIVYNIIFVDLISLQYVKLLSNRESGLNQFTVEIYLNSRDKNFRKFSFLFT